MRILLLLLFIAEVYLGALCTRHLGFFNTFLIYFLPTFLSVPFFGLRNQLIWSQFQRQLAMGKKPDRQVLNLASQFLGFILFLIPSLISRMLGILILFPPTRFVLMAAVQIWIVKKLAQGSFRFFKEESGFGGGSASFYYQNRSSPEDFEARVEREAQVIDIESHQLDKPR